MDAIEWLERSVDEFNALSQLERSAPMHFSLLWSLFEAKALGASGSARTIPKWAHDLNHQGKLNADAFTPAIAHFKERHFSNGQLTSNFDGLNIRKNDNRTLVEAVISGKNVDPTDCAVALFIIIYRLRNNYFHGSKWAYNLRDQLENFTAANESIMAVFDMSQS